MNNSKKDQAAKELAVTMSKFKTVAAAQAWWKSLSASQKGAAIGLIVGCGMGGYAFFATYKAYGVGAGIWAFILHGSIAGACTASISASMYTTSYKSATTNLGDDL